MTPDSMSLLESHKREQKLGCEMKIQMCEDEDFMDQVASKISI